jgi:predicted nucleic acid-binding protein
VLVIADTGSVNNLLLVGHIDILPALFGNVILPSVVRDELTDCAYRKSHLQPEAAGAYRLQIKMFGPRFAGSNGRA